MQPPMELKAVSRQNFSRMTRQGYPVFHSEHAFEVQPVKFPKCYACLGRNGDLMIVLRALKMVADWTGAKPNLIVSREYREILDGASYVNPIVIPQSWWDGVPEARNTGRSMFGEEPCVLQCHGRDWGVPTERWPSYHISMWDRTKVPLEYCANAPLVFDQRDPKREAILTTALKRNGKPLFLYNFTGVSSPFQPAAQILIQMRKFEAKFQFINLGNIKAFRIYDLLAFYDMGAILVTTDTATLHLAAASHIPVVAYTVNGWGTSTPPKNTIIEVKYGHALGRWAEVERVITRLMEKPKPVTNQKVYLCFTDYQPKDPDTLRRNQIAQKTWVGQAWELIPIKDEQLPRLWKEEGRQFAYIKDVFDFACAGKNDNDIIVYLNADIHARTDCCQKVVECLQGSDACYSYRRDFPRLDAPIADELFHTGHDYCGSDLCGFRVGWWKKVRNEFPDMVLALESWDPCYRVMADQTNAGKNAALKDIICHSRHSSHWERPENRYRLKGQIHCLKEASRFLRSRGINPQIHGIPPNYA
jgi:hypothetical protein